MHFDIVYIPGEDNIADCFSRYINNISQIHLSQEDRQAIISEYHRHSDHGSKGNMNFLIRQRYQWPNISKDIRGFVFKCVICMKSANLRQNTKNKAIMTNHPNELWEIDLIGPVQCNDNSKKYIVIAIDHFTKWVETRTIVNKGEKNIVKMLDECIFKKHSIPKRLLSDQGLEFDNIIVRDFCRIKRVEWDFGSPYHHKTMGAVERENQSLMNIIKKISNYAQNLLPEKKIFLKK